MLQSWGAMQIQVIIIKWEIGIWSSLPAVVTYFINGIITTVTHHSFLMITGTYVISFCLLLHFPICLYGAAQRNFGLVKMSEWTDKGEEKRWKAKLHWRSLFRTSNRECFSQQSAGLQGDRVVISWQRGAGHVGTTQLTSKTPDLKNADCTHTLSVSV